MNNEQLEKEIKRIIRKHSDIISIKSELIISNHFRQETGGITKFDEIALEIVLLIRNNFKK